MSLYDKYSKIRDENNMTDYKVAKETGIPQSSIYDWKYDVCTPKIDKLKKIADLFGVPVTEFIE